MDKVHTGCPLCDREDIIAGDPESNFDLEFNGDEGILFLFDKDNCIGHFHINFCPKCGRKLI